MEDIIGQILNFRDFVIELFSPYFGWIQFASLVISGLLLWGIIYFMIKSTFVNMKIEQWMDILRVGDLTKRRSIKRLGKNPKKFAVGRRSQP